MIKYLMYKDINVEKYDRCIENSLNSRVYAFSWYLDIVADNWDALILNDYEAVMPLPWRSKYFIKYIYPPCWTQQLGVFSNDAIKSNLVEQFIKKIPSKFKKVTIQFNSENPIQGDNIAERNNYVLPLNKSYEDLSMKYNKNRKRILKNSLGTEVVLEKDINSKEFLSFFLETKKDYVLKTDQISTLENLLSSTTNKVNIWGCKLNGELIAGLIWLKDGFRITYMAPIANIKAKEIGGQTLLVDQLIKQFANSNFILDFEGSMINGVAEFYRSFGARIEKYNNSHSKRFF